MNRSLIYETIKVLESCEAKLEYLGRQFTRTNFTDRYEDGPDCLHRAYKARDIINTLRSRLKEEPNAAEGDEGSKK
jgi:hypothetical protein